ncbi:T9SS type A sorting domain-containing protein [Mariniflexile gromovii]|uniref:T9SS type A sorting domain-containing protein n=1 Tax=Mariniflexile gromovii TaxID=362523 RepID=A0ABS4BZB4_9FLAO|nr:T9SS type A sorting domain-containing protein [Mariniflexile gromovii]MBP0905411.1 T9SS type A sorting domain-containing protein [Mariniflexile gromovii]
MKKILLAILFISMLLTNKSIAQESLQGSWGVRLIVSGGSKLDNNAADDDWVTGAQEIVDELPSAGHVITNFTHPAHGYHFTLRTNANVDIANEIHPDFVPSLENEQIILDVINVLKNGGKKVILYIATDGPSARGGTPDNATYEAAWANYYNTKFGGDEGAAWRNLARGFAERFKGLADGYWLDHTGSCPGGIVNFIAMLKDVDPTLSITGNGVEENVTDYDDYFEYPDGTIIQVDTDGLNDTDLRKYRIKSFNTFSPYLEFTSGHPTPLAQGAPPNSWAYEEFTFPEIIAVSTYFNPDTDLVKHAWIPMRQNWTNSSFPLLFEVEQAYRFVRTLTDGNCAITWGNTQTDGKITPEEMSIMKEIDSRLQMSPMPDYVPYSRPEGALLVGESANNRYQLIFADQLPDKELGDSDIPTGALASSGLPVTTTSSDTSVATIINNQIHIVGIGTTTITHSQAGNSEYNAAVNVSRTLTVVEELNAITAQVIVTSDEGDQRFALNETLNPTITPGLLGVFSTNTTYTQLRGTNTVLDNISGKLEFYVQSDSGNKTGHIAFDFRTIVGTQATVTVTVEGLSPQVYNVVNTNTDILINSVGIYDEYRLDFTNAVNFSNTPIKVSIEVNDLDQGSATTVTAARFYNFYYTNQQGLSTNTHIKKNKTFKVSPNPVQHGFSLVGDFNEDIEQIEIFNMAGVLVKTLKGQTTNYNISDLSPGLYLAKAKTVNQITVVKLIKE